MQSAILRYVYTLRLIGPISYLGACYIRAKVTKCQDIKSFVLLRDVYPINPKRTIEIINSRMYKDVYRYILEFIISIVFETSSTIN